MQRRHFLKLTSSTAAAVLLSRLTYATSLQTSTINMPSEVWALSGNDWFKLKLSNGAFSYKDIEVTIKTNDNAKGVYVTSPSQELNAVRLKWAHNIPATATFLGDAWERSYGDLQWKTNKAGVKNPWYVIIHDTKQTACFGVKTGCNTLCWWG
jgi:alpha-galactosidase